jgi:glycosyltransferase involved in cell wall biosynthesis
MNNRSYKLLIAHYRPDIVSGAENSITDLTKQLDRRFQVTMLVPGGKKLTNFFQKNGIIVWEKSISTTRRKYPGLHLIQSLAFAIALRRYQYDAVICNTIAAGYRVSSAAKFARLPLAIHMRDYISNPKTDWRILARADAIFAISKDVGSAVSECIPGDKIFLAYNFINPDNVVHRQSTHLAGNQRVLFPPGCDIIGWIGRLTPYKQPEVFIRAIPIVLAEIPNARFVIVGSAQDREKPYEEGLKILTQALGVGNNLLFLGQRNDVIELASEFTISCLTSKREPLGRVILEASLLQKAAVVPNIGGPAEIIEHGLSGLQFDPLSVNAHYDLARHIITLLKNPDLRNNLAANAYTNVKQRFASHDPVTNHEFLYEQLCSHQL